jgi:hypothetical protein
MVLFERFALGVLLSKSSLLAGVDASAAQN